MFNFSKSSSPAWNFDEEEPEGILFEYNELTQNVSAVVKLIADDEETGSVIDYSYSISPAYPQGILTITADEDGVRITAPSLAGFFPIEFVHYLQDGESVFADFWHDVPMGSEIVEFRPSTLRTFTYSLTVAATTSSGTEYSTTLDMTVEHDWTPGKLKLLEYVDAIRSANG
ncbi:hypothetical protein [Marinomonas ostreistagni]|uniref:Uncharacterized protein n=1 Tax=Marinomonas ostreistagni TaxID=359209 RepID=A0ABS0ZAR2_9GAMM|nr:hypothetical protein [Marinomonas ostreistagni]MBJ7550742.1 hypothetical protein [Marinomonas ostreistagni]